MWAIFLSEESWTKCLATDIMIVRATPVQGLSIYIKKRNYQIPTSVEINVQRENSFHNAQTPKTNVN